MFRRFLILVACSVLVSCVNKRDFKSSALQDVVQSQEFATLKYKQLKPFFEGESKRERLLVQQLDEKGTYFINESKVVRLSSGNAYRLEFFSTEESAFNWKPNQNEFSRLLSSETNLELMQRFDKSVYRGSERSLGLEGLKDQPEKQMKAFLRWQGGPDRPESVIKLLTREETNKNNELRLSKFKELVQFVLNQYKKRRDWGDTFSMSFLNVMYLHFERSDYLVVRSLAKGEPIVATIRFIRAPYGLRVEREGSVEKRVYGKFGPTVSWEMKPSDQGNPFADEEGYKQRLKSLSWFPEQGEKGPTPFPLPMEKSLGLYGESALPRDCEPVKDNSLSTAKKEVLWCAGRIYEPGSFAILKESASESKPLLYKMIERYMERTKEMNFHPSQSRLFYTYNDLPSLYARIGFKAFGKEILAYGTKWRTLAATSDRLDAYLEKWNKSESSKIELVKNDELDETMRQDACKIVMMRISASNPTGNETSDLYCGPN